MGVKFKHPDYKTISFLIIDELGYLPREGQGIVLFTVGNSKSPRCGEIQF